MALKNYNANAGQTFMPFHENIDVPILEFQQLEQPGNLMDLKMSDEFLEKGYILNESVQHFIPGVTAQMLDWFWANMEKAYYLWAPGSHKRFSWKKEPWKYGFVNSVHIISEVYVPGMPVFGGEGVEIRRMGLEWFPFTEALEHVIVEAIFNEQGEFFDSTVHMWEGVEGGIIHVSAGFMNPKCSVPPQFILESLDSAPTPEQRAFHSEYEAAMWPVFLPKLYDQWINHPDPTQNVQCNLRVQQNSDGKLSYVEENGPVHL